MKSLSLRSPAASTRLLLAGLVLAVAGTAALTVQAQPGPGGAGHHHRGDMGGMGLPMFGGHVDRMLDSVKATDAQRTQVKQIVAAAAADMKAQRESGRALREQMQALFTQPVVDARAAEALRRQMLDRHDQASKRMMQAMLDVSGVLTVEQRQQLAQQMKQRRDMMERHMRERRQFDGAPKSGS
jgi:Spy/CpxP family protein refolding chaperone